MNGWAALSIIIGLLIIDNMWVNYCRAFGKKRK